MTTAGSSRRARVLAVTSGKGGVGKTNLAINISVALARQGHRVAVVDGDFGLGNIDVMLGLTPASHVGHLLSGEKSLADVLIEGPHGLHVLPAGSGVQALTALSPEQRNRLEAALDQLRSQFDFLVIDTGAGISDNVLQMLKLAEHVLLVTSMDPAALVDAYALAKVLWRAWGDAEVGLIVNCVQTSTEARLAFHQIDRAAARFLGRNLRYLGFVPDDPAVRDATLHQQPIVDHLPQTPASRSLRLLAARLATLGARSQGVRLLPPPGPVGPTEAMQWA